MELVERYLQAIRFWLPKEQKHDIIAELSEDIQAQIEERESALGRTLHDAEVEALLKQRGHPMLVANRYVPQRSLIGPVLFPTYLFVLKVVTLCYVVPTLFWIATVAFGHLYPDGHIRQSLLSGLGAFWLTGFVSTATVTLVFAAIERVPGVKSRLFEDWNPRKLPPVRHFNLITRPAASFELAANLLMTIWWAAYASSPIALTHLGVQISLSPVWPYFFWGYLCLGLVNTALSAANLIRPYWTGLRAFIRFVSDCTGAALFCWLLKTNIVAGMVIANVTPERARQISDSTNMWLERMLPAAILVSVIVIATSALRVARLKTTRFRLPWEAVVSA